eukprot:COSAG02_NODE_1_length_108762_cov_456.708287_97_plen_470_part_00
MEGANAYALREEEERHLAQRQQLRPAGSENRSAELGGAWTIETQRVAQESEQLADLVGQLAEIVDGHDAPLDTILDNADDTVGTLLDGTEAVGEKGKADAARTHKRNVPLAVGAVSGIVGAVTLTPVLGALTGAAGAAVGYGVGTKMSGAIADSIDSELQVARDIAENDGVDRGPLVATDTLEWRWGDVGIGKLVESNPLRWASGSPAAILRDLRSRSEKEQLRPVVLRWKRAGRDSSATFETVRATVRWIEDTLAGRRAPQASPLAPNPALAQHASGGTSKSTPATELAGEYGQNEHLHRAVRHAARAGSTIAEIVPRLAVQGEKVDRAHSKAAAAEGVIAAASRANKSRTVLGAMGAAWAGPGREVGGSVSASTARQKPVWIRSHQAPVCMLCEKEFRSGGGKHHCRYCGWAVCTACSLHSIVGLERWLKGDKPHAICLTRSTEGATHTFSPRTICKLQFLACIKDT